MVSPETAILVGGSKTRHCVSALDGGGCRFVIIQGLGTYDYVAMED